MSTFINDEVDDGNIIVCGSDSEEFLETFAEHFDSESILAVDCEGVNLGRTGTIELVQVSTPHMNVLFDVQGVTKTSKIALFLKKILGDPTKIKIMFDCRIDSDALYHHLGVTLDNVHDAQVYDMINSNNTNRPNLKKCMLSYGIEITTRDSNVYATNFRYWATRPLTMEMKERATGDVNQLFELRERQLELMSESKQNIASTESQVSVSCMKDGLVASFNIKKSKIGLFIGRGGSNLRSLECRFNCQFQTQKTDSPSLPTIVYAPNQQVLDRVIMYMHINH